MDKLKRFRRFAKQVKKLSTTQKVVGGLALLAAGHALVTKTSASEAPAEAPAADEPAPDTPPNPGSKASTSKPRRTKPSRTPKHSPFSEERP
jgi:hypothetical protein